MAGQEQVQVFVDWRDKRTDRSRPRGLTGSCWKLAQTDQNVEDTDANVTMPLVRRTKRRVLELARVSRIKRSIGW